MVKVGAGTAHLRRTSGNGQPVVGEHAVHAPVALALRADPLLKLRQHHDGPPPATSLRSATRSSTGTKVPLPLSVVPCPAVRRRRRLEAGPREERVMRAAVVKDFREPLEITQVPTPEPGPGEVLVRVEATGL